MGMNMLSAKKVKLHGMQDSRWNVTDHLTQYKGLVKLFQRDRKIIDFDTKLKAKKYKKEIKQILKDIFLHRQELEKCSTVGDKQNIRNLLAGNRSMKLAYQELHKITDHIFQDNFLRRKTLDSIYYKLKIKMEKLIKLKLEEGDLQNQLKYEVQGKTPLDVQIGIVTGKVQDMILKKEGAITVNTTYSTLIALIKKDAIYYDAVLETLREDALSQCHCIIQTTKLGQMATEYLDDRKVEFDTLQIAVKEDMKLRLLTLERIKKQIEDTVTNMRQLIRRDSDMTMGHLPPLAESPSFKELNKDVTHLKVILNNLQEVTMVSQFDRIFPSMFLQTNQYKQLLEMLEKFIKDKERLLKRKAHAEQICMKLTNSIVDSTGKYKSRKAEIKNHLKHVKENLQNTKEMIKKRGNLLVNIRKNLQLFEMITQKIIVDPNKLKQTSSDMSVRVEPLESDGHKLIAIISERLYHLKRFSNEEDMTGLYKSAKEPKEAESVYANLVERSSKYLNLIIPISEGDLVDEMVMEDAQIPTRDFVKEQSKEICRLAALAEI